PAFLYAGHPLASIGGQFNAVTVEADAITEITMSGPGAGGPQTASAVLGDLLSVISSTGSPGPPLHPVAEMPLLADADSAFYLHMEVADEPGVLVAVAGVLDRSGASVKSVLQRGLGENARLVMVTHPLSESRLRGAVREIGELPFVRAAPRAIRVIEEEF
ncbi:MAG: ACT domain-containing protein, partial [Solirubrobacteraceae bacterium]